MVKVGTPATVGQKELRTEYPVKEGLIAGTTKQTGNPNLEEEGYQINIYEFNNWPIRKRL